MKKLCSILLLAGIGGLLFHPAFAQTRYEAENAALTGVTVATSHGGYSGSGYVDGFDANGDKVTFTVNVSSAGSYPLVIRYSAPSGEKMQDLVINGVTVRACNLTFAANSGWVDLNYGNVNLNAGNNTIAIVKCYGWFHLDYLSVGSTPPPVTTTKYEAEAASLTGVSTASTETGYSGTGYADGNTLDATGDKITFTVSAASAGAYPLVIRFKNTCGACEKYQNVAVNGAAAVNTQFNGTTGGWQDKAFGNVNLNAGSNTITISKGYGWTHIDYITVGASGGTPTTYTLSVSASNGSVSKNPNKTAYASGETVTLTATPNSGYVFSNWSGSASGTANPLTLTMNGNKSITANFTATGGGGVPPLVDPQATTETRNLWNYLHSVNGQKVLSGIWEKSGLDNVRENSGKTAAILGQDMTGWHPRQTSTWYTVMAEQRNNLINHYNNGGIVQVNWHWANPFDYSKDAWSSLTTEQWNRLVTPGTAEYNTIIADIDLHVNNYLKLMVDRNNRPIPVLFRPLHEIDGGWFWWTNKNDPGKTVQLYKMVFDRIKNYHGLHNLIWVWNNSEVATSAAQSGAFYPGSGYADIVGIDLYHIDYQNTGRRTNWDGTYLTYADYYRILGQIAPGKPRALCEGDALPNGDKTQNGDASFVKWLYALAWWSPSDNNGTGMCYTSPCNPASWVNTTYNHNVYLTLDELTTNGSSGGRKGLLPDSREAATVAVYPNPATRDNLTLHVRGYQAGQSVHLELFNASGQALCRKQATADAGGICHLTVPDKAARVGGMYLIRLVSDTEVVIRKIVIQ